MGPDGLVEHTMDLGAYDPGTVSGGGGGPAGSGGSGLAGSPPGHHSQHASGGLPTSRGRARPAPVAVPIGGEGGVRVLGGVLSSDAGLGTPLSGMVHR